MPISLSSSPTCLAIFTLLSATTVYFFYKSRRHLSKRLKSLNPIYQNHNPKKPRGKLFFISQTGTSRTLAQNLHSLLNLNGFDFDLVDLKDYEPEDLHKESFVLIVASTWENGKPPSNAEFFVDWLTESADDFRVGSLLLSKCKFAIFGVGSGSYGETFNAVAREFSKKLRKLGGVEVLGVFEGDVDEGNVDEVFGKWSKRVVGVLSNLGENRGYTGNGVGDGSEDEVLSEEDDDEFEENDEGSGIVDLEDIAGKGPSRKKGVGDKLVNGKLNGGIVNGEKAMVTPVIRASLEKQGYKIIGSHSGVKLCRWTKSQLRGRGGCYKHSFYGIESHRLIATMAGVVNKFFITSLIMWAAPIAILYAFNHNLIPGVSEMSPHSMTLASGFVAVISVNVVIAFYICMAMREPSDKHEPDPKFLAEAKASVKQLGKNQDGDSSDTRTKQE